MGEGFSWQQIARIYDVPPWIINAAYPIPRFARLRWKLRRIWPLKERPEIPSPGYERALRNHMDQSLYGFRAEWPDGSRIDPRDIRPTP